MGILNLTPDSFSDGGTLSTCDLAIKKAESMTHDEVLDYCTSLFPIDDYFDDYLTIASFEANRFVEARSDKKLDSFLPVCNEGKLVESNN